MSSDKIYIGLTPIGWNKLDFKCDECGEDHANIEFTFSCKGLPPKYFQYGTFIRAWHWKCLPEELRNWQYNDEMSMLKTAMTPPGRNS